MQPTLYAHRLSQPSRAVEILLRELACDYAWQEVDFAGGATRTAWFTELNPLQTVPALALPDDAAARNARPPVLGESQAIMRYLCRTADETATAAQWYPGDRDPHRTARIDQWLAWHHGALRRFDMFHHIMNLHLTQPMLKREIQATLLRPLQEGLNAGLATLEAHFARQPADSPLTVTGDPRPTLADLALGCELYQIAVVGYRFDRYPRVARWLEDMAQRRHFHEVSREVIAQGRTIREQSGPYLELDTAFAGT
ncbi:glutathione S-transferase [Kushneria sinocarnis]|uniref:Glutathione S-transferase n=1 Tax=Kushneria sinocarnis TaxID=595502 RepID=A0A420X022_9GAMM|nr:glutathione S-transferase family protein [Kushneria sinocarnis]RKR07196.1 glutathione S-transferase [Kushneria sinocarnis]